MPPPTLLVPGKVKLPEGVHEAPIDFILKWLRRRMPEYGGHEASLANRILIVRSETGSGKSTVLPVHVFRILRSQNTPARVRFSGPGVICTQPKVLTALALAADVAAAHSPWNPDMVIGETLGFQTGRFSDKPASGLIFATAGVLAAQLGGQDDAEILDRYRFIIVDEAHERSVDSDVTIMLLRNFYLRNAGNPRLPFLLLASATFDPGRYAAYFGVGAANVVEVEGRAYGIETHWPARGTNDYPAEAVATVLRIHAEHPDDPPERADVLVFVPGGAEGALIEEGLRRANERLLEAGASPLLVLTINSEVVGAQGGGYQLVFAPPGRLPPVGGRPPGRRVVIATNVAETGLTIDTLRYVVDCGWSRGREAYQPWGAEGIVTRPAPRSRVLQRKGRVGRLFPGDFYPLYTLNVFEALDAQQIPDVFAAGYDGQHLAVVREQQRQKLQLGRAAEFRVEDLSLLDPPPPEVLLAAGAAAAGLGFVSPRAPLPGRWPPEPLRAGGIASAGVGFGLTPLGFVASRLSRVSMEGARVLLAGYSWGAAASDLATAVALFGSSLGALLSAEERLRKGGLPAGAAALREALPGFLAGRAGGGGAPVPPAESEAFFFRARLLLADDFAEGVLVFDAFARRLAGAGGDLGVVGGWCEALGLDLAALGALTEAREDVLAAMAEAGLDPFRGDARRLAVLPPDEFTDGLVRFKRCLYDGLRGRTLRLADEGGGYLSAQGLRVAAPPLLADAMVDRLRALGGVAEALKPRWLVTDQFRLRAARKRPGDAAGPLLYDVKAGMVSVLDGFVSPDPDFAAARCFPDS